MLRALINFGRMKVQRACFDNRQFWNQRYQTNIGKGSGPGSRGEILRQKRDIIAGLQEKTNVSSIIDLGCGDIELMQGLDIQHYYGVDISDVVVARNKSMRPDWEFQCIDISSLDLRGMRNYDLTVCVDVLIHQKSFQKYKDIIEKIREINSSNVLISGYNQKPSGWNVFFHEPLADTLSRLMPDRTFEAIYKYRETDLLVSCP